MQVVLNVDGSIRTIGRGHDREVVALYRWPLVQVPLYGNNYYKKQHIKNMLA